ncbi:MAG: MBL fold metallo-hydrolase [Pyrinomonadaceae bacterium]
MVKTFPPKCLRIFLIFLIPMTAWSQTLKVTLLGTGTPVPIVERFGPSILVEAGSEKLLFDCGRGSTLRLWQLHIPMRDVTAVFFTHLHSDHIVGFPDLWLTGWLPSPFGLRNKPMRVYGPVGTSQMMRYLKKAYQADIRIRMADEKIPPVGAAIFTKEITEGVVYEKNGVKVTAFNVDHGKFIKPAFGYRIDYQGRSVVLSGDTRFSENLIRFSNGADVLFHEVGVAKAENLSTSDAARRIIGHHTTPEDAGRVFDRVKPRLAVYTHIVLLSTDLAISPPTVEDLVTRTRQTYPGPLEVGEDLMSVEVGEKIAVHRFNLPPH